MSSTPDADDDLEAGWDLPDAEPAQPLPALASNDTAAWDAAADELDAGWDIEPSASDIEPSAPARAPHAKRPEQAAGQRRKTTAADARQVVTKPSALQQPSAKKLERAMLRKQREREAQARAKREVERKSQRQAEQAKRAERLPPPEARKLEKRPRIAQRKTERANPKTESKSNKQPAAPRELEGRPYSRREPAELPRTSPRKPKAISEARAKRRRIIGGVLTLVALALVVFIAWKLAR